MSGDTANNAERKRNYESSGQLTSNLLVEINRRYQPRCLIFRLNVIAGKIDKRFVRSAPPGVADIIGAIRNRAIAIEIKAGQDRMRKNQIDFRDSWIRAGGIHVVARSVEQAMADLEMALQIMEELDSKMPAVHWR